MDALAENLKLSSADGLKPPELKLLFDHSRSLFQYHAAQRHDSLRNFLTAFGLFSTVDVALHVKAPLGMTFDAVTAPMARLVLDLTLFGLTLIFWALDFRNAQMVEIDERASEELEALIAYKFGLQHFDLVYHWRKPGQFRRYGNLTKIFFGWFSFVFFVVLCYDAGVFWTKTFVSAGALAILLSLMVSTTKSKPKL